MIKTINLTLKLSKYCQNVIILLNLKATNIFSLKRIEKYIE